MPQTPIFGSATPDRTSASCPRRTVRSTSPGSIRATASIRPMCVVTCTTFTLGVDSIIDTSSVPVRWASSSVWPGKRCPAACSASLFSGAVQIPCTAPETASSAATRMYW